MYRRPVEISYRGFLRGKVRNKISMPLPQLSAMPAAAMRKKASSAVAPVVPVVRKTFPESWLWETVGRLVFVNDGFFSS